ncbi:hypothetical protein L873DRAFT_1820179 [Choiromyces venosus 120613-1]|uniref:Branchpoint-bridging protein n=1 Tax=Choiromyces venosus 120613-1 TaxID=1336337 RepID=A0A3N4IXS0_9PEZI|nr:hypothetical protein L873DRAFT_1820179 [Choiromyces venosus 120613-1]
MWHKDRPSTGTNSIPIKRERRLPGLVLVEDETPLVIGDPDERVVLGSSVSKTPDDSEFSYLYLESEEAVSRGWEKQHSGTAQKHSKTRCGSESIKSNFSIDSLPTSIPGCMSLEDTNMYALKVRIEEITQKLSKNLVARYREHLEAERHDLVAQVWATNPQYRPPSHYRKLVAKHEKVYVPVGDYPEINFIGLLIGPRGHTLKHIEKESGVKVAIHGKGSIKEGKGGSDLALASDQDENLHCLIISPNPDFILKAKKMINEIIETATLAVSTPETSNTLKGNQLREFASLNGTLHDDEGKTCSNCGEIGHCRYDCAKETNYTAGVICRVCDNVGHFGRDCMDRPRGWDWRDKIVNSNSGDHEYEVFIRDVLRSDKATVGQIANPPTGPRYGNNTSGMGYQCKLWEGNSGAAQAPWTQADGTLVQQPSTSFIKSHEIKNHSIPKGPKAEGDPICPWSKSQSGRGSNEGPGVIGQNKGNMNSRTPVSSNRLHENSGSRERDSHAEMQSRANRDLSPQKDTRGYTGSGGALGYNRDNMSAHDSPCDFQDRVTHNLRPWDKDNSKPYPLAAGHTGFQWTVGERASNGFSPWSRPPPPPIQTPPRSPPPPPSEPPADGFDPRRWN